MLKVRHKSTRGRVAHQGDPRLIVRGTAPPGRSPIGLVDADSRGKQVLPPSHVWRFCSTLLQTISGSILASILMVSGALAAPPGAIIANQAMLEYQDLAGQPAFVVSNQVSVVTAVVRSPSSIELTRVLGAGAGVYQETVGPSACFQAGSNARSPSITRTVAGTSRSALLRL